jgi:hypothetical protein
MSSLILLGLCAPGSVHHHHLPLAKRRSQEVLDVSLEGLGIGVAPSKHIDSPIPERLIEAISVRFLPLFLGTRP